MAKNIQNVRFLRNSSLRATREDAISALSGQTLTDKQDGTIILARYGSGSEVKTLAGLVYANGDNKSITIIDVEGAGGNVEELRQEINAKLGDGVSSANTVTAQLTALSGGTFTPETSSSADTSVEGAKAYAYELIGTLDYADTAETGSYVSKVDQSDGKISVTRVALPTVGEITEAGKPIIAVAEDKGTIAASAGTIDAQYVNVTGSTFTATTVQGALEEIDGEYKAAIEGLDGGVTAETGYFVKSVSEVDGKISGTTEALPTVTDTAVAKKFVIAVDETNGEIAVERGEITSSGKTVVLTDNADGGVNFEVNIDNDTIVQDETTKALKVASAALTQYVGDENTIHVSSADTNNNKTVSSLLTIKKVTDGLPSEVKEEYYLVGEDEITIGSPVTIYKDSHIVSITYITDSGDTHYQNLEYKYIDASGATKTEYVDISSLVLEAEFASGITVTNHVAHGVVDPTSESFLTVGADGFKLSGVQSGITTAIEALDVTDDTVVPGQYVAAIEETDGIVAVKTRANVSEAVLNNYSKGSDSGAVVAADSINQAISKLENQIDAVNNVVEELDSTVTGETRGSHITISIEELDGKLVQSGLTIEENDIASASDLAALSAKTITDIDSANGSITVTPANAADGTQEIDLATDASKIKMSGFTAAQSGFTAITEDTTITKAVKAIETAIIDNKEVVSTALNNLRTDIDTVSGDVEHIADDVETISGKVDTIETNYVSGVSVNGSAVTVANHVAPISITAATSAVTATSTEAIVIDTGANGQITLGLADLDAGFYDQQ